MRALYIPLLFLAATSLAQSWCPPGANWHFRDISFTYEGYLHRAYTGDTIVLGQPAQRIVANGMRVYLPGTPGADTTWIINEITHTSLQNDVLMVPAWSPSGLAWDTLLRFDAVPGDRWYLPNYYQYCNGQEPYGVLQVLDTSHVIVEGVSLRRWSVGTLGFFGEVLWNQFYYERIGFLDGLIPFPFCGAFIELGESLKCYWDNSITFIAPGQPIGTTCDITLGAPSPVSTDMISAAPNPGREQLMLTLPASSHRVELIDALGRIHFTHANLTGTATIATAHLPSGAYVIRVEDAYGSRTSLRWIKE
ncbi:MAG: T9SS type A sorting domain-containing protein [Flavobacteriales bacterium]